MNLADRDLKTQQLLRLLADHRSAIAQGFQSMQHQAETKNCGFLREVVDEHIEDIKQTIAGLKLQKDALDKLIRHIDILCSEDNYRNKATEHERRRILKEIGKVDKRINSLEDTL